MSTSTDIQRRQPIKIGYITNIDYPPYHYDCELNTPRCRHGIAVDIVRFLCDVVRLDHDWVPVPGHLNDEQRLDFIVDGRIDVLADLKAINYDRHKRVGFTIPVMAVHRGFISSLHDGRSGQSIHEIEFSKALAPVVWYCFFGACLLVSFMASLSALTAYWEGEKTGILQAVLRGTWFTTTTTFAHSHHLKVRNPLVHKYLNILFHFWSTIVFLSQGLYSNLITTSLLVPAKTVHEYQNLTELTPLLEKGVYSLILGANNLYSGRSEQDQQLVEMVEEGARVVNGNMTLASELLKSRRVIMYGGEWTLSMIEAEDKPKHGDVYCKYGFIRDNSIDVQWKAFPVRKKFPYTQAFSLAIYNNPQMLNYITQSYNKSGCKPPYQLRPPPVKLENVANFFKNFQYAIYLVFLVILLEKVRFTWENRPAWLISLFPMIKPVERAERKNE